MGDFSRFDEGVLLHCVSLQENNLYRIDVFVDGTKLISHVVKRDETGPTALNALAAAFSRADLGTSAVNGALVWSRVNVSKQEAGHIKRIMLFFWGIVRAFLP